MNKIEKLNQIIEKNLEYKTKEFKRVFHGRGNFYNFYESLTVDSIDTILLICFYKEYEDEKELIELFNNIFKAYNFKTLVIQKRYLDKQPHEILQGKLEEKNYIYENGLKFSINFDNRNLGLFPDMKIGREYIKEISKDKNVLNLFSYTCAFSVYALAGGAKQVVNVDMAKGALSTGRENHHLNNLDTKKVKFLPFNILKSWSKIKKFAPYDVIIIDPPSFQKGSFAATKDYEKIIRRLNELASDDCVVLSCLNAPELDTTFIKNIFEENALDFKFVKRLDNLENFPSNDDEKSLKNLIFKKENNG
ncbi:class I SAM-dependent methyltransferase [Halarcobacter sp.]|uniref:class I SAM-dependent methyltransferase n=1 Tax=Halarcobacter sp. TaxID=2321133 RepID=UPI0029F53BB5|nr:class I SAM-dependent methyltransferase [Halarcobacter sp.]